MTAEASSTNESDEPLPEQRITPEILGVDKQLLETLLGEIHLAERDLRTASMTPGLHMALQRADSLSRARKALEASTEMGNVANEDTEELIRIIGNLATR